jgi:hypothetical protein
VVPAAIGKIDQLRLIYLDKACVFVVKTVVVFCDDGIMGGGALQFVG